MMAHNMRGASSLQSAASAATTVAFVNCSREAIVSTSPYWSTSLLSNDDHQPHRRRRIVVRHFAHHPSPSLRTNTNERRKLQGGGGKGDANAKSNNRGDMLLTNAPHHQPTRNILIIGSQGELGKTLVSHFGNQTNWNVLGADVVALDNGPSSPTENEDVDGPTTSKKKGLKLYITLPRHGSVADLSLALYRGVSDYLHSSSSLDDNNKNYKTNKSSKVSSSRNLDAIVCASGGWTGDVNKFTLHRQAEVSANEFLEDIDIDEEYVRESAEACDRMMRMNYYPIVAGSLIGELFLNGGGSGRGRDDDDNDQSSIPHNNNGLFVIIGASAALSPTPGMLGYGSAKAAAHHYLQSYGPTSIEEYGITSVGILPLMLDTPANRAMLGDVDDDNEGEEEEDDDRYSKMVKPIHIANEIGEWIKHPHLRPHSGSLVKVIAKNRRDGRGGAAFHLVR